MKPALKFLQSSRRKPASRAQTQEFRDAVQALHAAAERLQQALDAANGGELAPDLLGHAGRCGLVLALTHQPWAPEKLAQLDPRAPLNLEDAEMGIGDALCDLAAYARLIGLNEEVLFARRHDYYEEFGEPLASTR